MLTYSSTNTVIGLWFDIIKNSLHIWNYVGTQILSIWSIRGLNAFCGGLQRSTKMEQKSMHLLNFGAWATGAAASGGSKIHKKGVIFIFCPSK